MHWIALQPPEPEREAWSFRALRFTPRVAWCGHALLLEIESCARLWGGAARLIARLVRPRALSPLRAWAQAPTALVALALLRLALRGEAVPAGWGPRDPGALPLDTLDAALPHVALLERMGCRTWGQARALPRAGVARRFGASLVDALDAAWGQRPEGFDWLALPERFDARLELPATATCAPELMWAAQRLLSQLQDWLAARQRGVLAFELEWTLDLRRLNGVHLPRHEQLAIRTARPTQGMNHLRRLVAEQLARATLSGPASHLRLRSLDTTPWAGASTSLLPEDQVRGERLHEFIERVSTRLGADAVVVPRPGDDHRPECMQQWVPAREAAAPPARAARPDALLPPWLLPRPQPLRVIAGRPQHGGPLRLVSRGWRMESAWWEQGRTPMRDYFMAQSPTQGLVWIYRERPSATELGLAREHRWFLQGLYA